MVFFEPNLIRLHKLPASLALGFTLLFPLSLMGAVQPVQPVQPIPPFELLDPINAPREYLSEKFLGFAESIDRFFGDERNYQESNQSVFQMDMSRVRGYGDDRDIVFSGRVKLHLPSTEKRLHLLLETDPEQNVSGETGQRKTAVSNRAAPSGRVAIGARYEKDREKESPWHFSTDAGVQFRAPLNPFARARVSYAKPLGGWRMNMAESVFWFNTIGGGETTQIDMDYLLSEPQLFRSSSAATWLHDKQNFDLGQSFSIFHTLNDRSAMLYQASVVGITHPQWQVNEYVILLLYRYRLHREWMFFEFSPQVHFPKEYNFRYTPVLSMRLEILFDGKK